MRPSRVLVMTLVSFIVLCSFASFSPAQTVNTVVTFDGTNGANPRFGILTQGRDGSLYGTTEQGGLYGLGTVYKLQTNGTITVLHSFSGTVDARNGRKLLRCNRIRRNIQLGHAV